MWDDFKCTKSAPKVPRALEKARALEKPPTVCEVVRRGHTGRLCLHGLGEGNFGLGKVPARTHAK